MSTQYPSYLIHYNKNHSKVNGQFVSGDGDGDGVVNDHKNDRVAEGEKKMRVGRGLAWGSIGAAALSGGTYILGDIFDSEIAWGASMASGLAAIALSTVGTGVYTSGKKAVKDAAKEGLLESVLVGDAENAKKHLSTLNRLEDD